MNRKKRPPVPRSAVDPGLIAFIETMEELNLPPEGVEAVRRLKDSVKSGEYQLTAPPVHEVAG